MQVYLTMLIFQKASILENNGQSVFTKLEIKLTAVHAGLSVLLKLYPTEFALPPTDRRTTSSHHNGWFLVINLTLVATEVSYQLLGSTYGDMVSQLKNAYHTQVVKELEVHAQKPVLMAQNQDSSKLNQLEPSENPMTLS